MAERGLKKEDYIKEYGEETYENSRIKANIRGKSWASNNPKKVKAKSAKYNPGRNRKGGKYYEKSLNDNRTGLRGKRQSIRQKHAKLYQPLKQIIAQPVESTTNGCQVLRITEGRHLSKRIGTCTDTSMLSGFSKGKNHYFWKQKSEMRGLQYYDWR